MPFSYYSRLTRSQQRVYRQSDGVGAVPLRGAAALRPLVDAVGRALDTGEPRRVQVAVQALLDRLTLALGVPPLRAEVRAVRPARDWGELHGLFTPAERASRARVTLWMRTARHRRIVAFRTFFRTLIHELCHHLDYEVLKLSDSFHTEGFYRRESSLVHQLLRAAARASSRSARDHAGGSRTRCEEMARSAAGPPTGPPDAVPQSNHEKAERT